MIREINVNSEAIAWLPWSVQYFFLIGLATISLIIGAVYYFSRKDKKQKHRLDVEFVASAIALASALIGALSLTAELHQPGRFLNFFIHPTPSSWMSLGSVILVSTTIVVVTYFLLLLRSRTEREELPKFLRFIHWGKINTEKLLLPVRILAIIVSIGIFVYTGSEVSIVAARPMWNTLLVPTLLFFTAIIGAIPLIQLFIYNQSKSIIGLSKVQKISLGVTFLLIFAILLIPNQFSKELYYAIGNDSRWLRMVVVFVFLSVGIGFFTFSKTPKVLKLSRIITQLFFALAFMWYLRWMLQIGVQYIPKFNATPNAYVMSWGSEGLFAVVASIGVFASALYLIYLLFNYIGYYPKKEQSKQGQEANTKRREWIKKSAVGVGGLAVFGTGFAHTFEQIFHTIKRGTSGKETKDRIYGNALVTEGRVASGQLALSPKNYIAFTQCNGCWTQCGVRVKVDAESNQILRTDGNPYNPLSQTEHFAYTMPVSEAMAKMTEDSGANNRSTACARGSVLHEGINREGRILRPMKRVGERGSGQWKSISYEQLVEEIVNGGNLFGEGEVEGLKSIYKPTEPIDPNRPSFGNKNNQLMVTYSGPDGRNAYVKRFAQNAFGTINFSQHGSYCGLSYRVGSGAVMNDLNKNKHAKPDWDHIEFALFWGTSPAQSGNPFKRQGRQLAERRKENNFEYAVIDPSMPNSMTLATKNNTWYPIQPGTDSAMAMAMIRYVIDNKLYNKDYLEQPNEEAMKKAGEKSYSNASHLVIFDENHPLHGQFLKEKHINKSKSESEITCVFDLDTKKIRPNNKAEAASLFGKQMVKLVDGSEVNIQTSLQCLKDSAYQYSIEEYSKQCGIEVDKIINLAKKFTSHKTKSAVIAHGGMMSGSGFYGAFSVLTLNVLIGNMNRLGGLGISGGKFGEFGAGPKYNLAKFPKMLKPKGLPIARSKRRYEDSDEYKLKVAKGENPYPSKAPWFPFAGGQMTEQLPASLAGYPYPIKAYLNFSANPVYGITGSKQVLIEKLKNPKNIPLFVASDAYMNETTALADYVVPDLHNYESWGFSTAWAGVPHKMTTVRWPVVDSIVEKTSEGNPISLEGFIIDVAKKIGLGGYGENIIADAGGKLHPLNTPEDYYLRAGANVAFAGKEVPKISEEELLQTGVFRIKPLIDKVLKEDEREQVAFVFSRGGRYTTYDSGWKKENDEIGSSWKQPLQIWNELVGKNRYSMTGKHYSGCATYFPPVFADGKLVTDYFSLSEWPFKIISYKSNILSSSTVHLPRLRTVRDKNIVAIHPKDAKKVGVHNGDYVKIKTPGGEERTQIVLLEGVARGVIAVEHGWGHKGFGANEIYLDGKLLFHDEKVGVGLNMNDLGFKDPSRKEVESPWLEWVSGASVRQGLPAKIVRI